MEEWGQGRADGGWGPLLQTHLGCQKNMFACVTICACLEQHKLAGSTQENHLPDLSTTRRSALCFLIVNKLSPCPQNKYLHIICTIILTTYMPLICICGWLVGWGSSVIRFVDVQEETGYRFEVVWVSLEYDLACFGRFNALNAVMKCSIEFNPSRAEHGSPTCTRGLSVPAADFEAQKPLRDSRLFN